MLASLNKNSAISVAEKHYS